MAQAWTRKLRDDSETMNWLGANTKDCPTCHKVTEKNGGCNHITCKCGAHWCWMCNKAFDTRTVYNHGCNAFAAVKPGTGSAQNAARAALDRYLHYYTRYDNHAKSKKLEAKVLDGIKAKMDELMQADAKNPSWIDNVYLEESSRALFECRDILKNTYVFGFYLFEPNDTAGVPRFADVGSQAAAKSQFEFHQEGLESTTERLSHMLEMNVQQILAEKAYRTTVLDLTKKALNMFEAMFEVSATLLAQAKLPEPAKAPSDTPAAPPAPAAKKAGAKGGKKGKGGGETNEDEDVELQQALLASVKR
jgi:ariadne-1